MAVQISCRNNSLRLSTYHASLRSQSDIDNHSGN